MATGLHWAKPSSLGLIAALALFLSLRQSTDVYGQKSAASDDFGLFLPLVIQKYELPHIAFLTNRSGADEIYVMAGDGSAPVQLTSDAVDKISVAWLPDHKQLAYCEFHPLSGCDLYTINTDGSGKKAVVAAVGIAPTWSPSGAYVAYIRGRNYPSLTIMTYPALADLRHVAPIRDFAWLPDSERITLSSAASTPPGIWTTNIDGSNPITLTQASGNALQWSADGSKLVFTFYHGGDNQDIYVVNADGSQLTNLTDTPSAETDPQWAPDGQTILFVAQRDGNEEIYHMKADGSAQMRLTSTPERDYHPRWSPDGTKIIFLSTRDGNEEIYSMDVDGFNQKNLTNHTAADYDFAW